MTTVETEMSGVLDDVHAAIRRGDLSQLARLTARMEAAEDGLRHASPGELAQIRARAERNMRTLTAARRGLRAARRRIAEVLAAARGLVTYDRQGQRVEETDARNLARRF
jgi:hypothetical protein